MEYIDKLDSGIDFILENDMFYSSALLILIIYATFVSGSHTIDKPNKIDKFFKINFTIPLIKILFMLLILYFSTKDIRISLLLLIIFFIEIDKIHVDEVNGELIALLVNDSILEEKITKLS